VYLVLTVYKPNLWISRWWFFAHQKANHKRFVDGLMTVRFLKMFCLQVVY
jgi:hypothetical protein